MSNVFSFHKKQYELILPIIHKAVNNLPHVYAYYLDAKNKASFYRSDEANHIEYDATFLKADEQSCKDFCKINIKTDKVVWMRKDRIPFFQDTTSALEFDLSNPPETSDKTKFKKNEKQKIPSNNKLLDATNNKNADSLFSNISDTCLCLRVQHDFDKAMLCYVIVFTKEFAHWGGDIGVTTMKNNKPGLSVSNKEILEKILYNLVINHLDIALRDKLSHESSMAITQEMLEKHHEVERAQETQNLQYKQSLLSLMYEKINSLAPGFTDKYKITQFVENKLISHFCKAADFNKLIKYLNNDLSTFHISNRDLGLTSNLFEERIIILIDNFSSHEITPNKLRKKLPEQGTLSPKQRVMEFLDALENVSKKILEQDDIQLTAKNICMFNPGDNVVNRFYGKKAASISVYLGKGTRNRDITLQLFQKYPIEKWAIIRTQFRLTKKIHNEALALNNDRRGNHNHQSESRIA